MALKKDSGCHKDGFETTLHRKCLEMHKIVLIVER